MNQYRSEPSLPFSRIAAAAAVAVAFLFGPSAAAQEPPGEAGVGFVLQSTDFGNPCTNTPGDIPRIYDNSTSTPVQVSFKIVNTGSVVLLVAGTGFAIPAAGPGRRPRVIRKTVAPGDSIGIQAQGANCAWFAVIKPH